MSGDPAARGLRCKRMRALTGLSRRKFSEKYHIPAPTIQNWEDAKGNGLSEKGAKRFLKAITLEGIHANLEWLLYGIGPHPNIVAAETTAPPSSVIQQSAFPLPKNSQTHTPISEELTLLRHHHPELVHLIITDDLMKPYAMPGDHLGGIPIKSDQYTSCLNQLCLVTLAENNMTLLRLIQLGKDNQHIKLATTNGAKNSTPQSIAIDQLTSIAPLMWWRRYAPQTVTTTETSHHE